MDLGTVECVATTAKIGKSRRVANCSIESIVFQWRVSWIWTDFESTFKTSLIPIYPKKAFKHWNRNRLTIPLIFSKLQFPCLPETELKIEITLNLNQFTPHKHRKYLQFMLWIPNPFPLFISISLLAALALNHLNFKTFRSSFKFMCHFVRMNQIDAIEHRFYSTNRCTTCSLYLQSVAGYFWTRFSILVHLSMLLLNPWIYSRITLMLNGVGWRSTSSQNFRSHLTSFLLVV